MKLTSEEALMMLVRAKSRGDDTWIRHSVCVGKTAGTIAKALNINVDYAKTLGYIHDIGKSVGCPDKHIMNGYYYLKRQGYSSKYYNVCLMHSFLNNDYYCKSGTLLGPNKFLQDFIASYDYSIYEKLISLCNLICTTKVVTLDKGLIYLILTQGVNENTQYHTYEAFRLKEYFDKKLGYNLYDLFPNIVENSIIGEGVIV